LKQIFVLAGVESLWDVIIRRLERINARVLILEMETAREAIERLRPDLLITGEEEHEALHSMARCAVRLIVSENFPAGRILRGREGREVVNLGWPFGEEDFVALTSRLLHVPERHAHRTDLKLREKITILFDGQDPEKKLRLSVSLVRSVPNGSGGPTLNAGRFVNLTRSERHSLEHYVWGIR
jgi:hypothetical protein